MPLPYNPAGLFSLVASYFASPGTTIRTEQHNPVFEDVASALSNVLLRDGRAPMTGSLNMNGQSINNVATGNTPSSVATLAQAMPIGAVIDFAGVSAPAGWALCIGQVVSRSTYATLFATIGTSFGAGDGSTTFNLPDLRGRVVAASDNMGGAPAGRITLGFGVAGGSQTNALGTSNLPPYTPSGSISDGPLTFTAPFYGGQSSGANEIGGGVGTMSGIAFNSTLWATLGTPGAANTITQSGSSFTGNSQGGSSAPFSILQPTIGLNKIIRVSYDV